ncbi:MAG TPA: cytochrome c oxidase subunit II [Candidatus Limnocylindrales bacterium]|nr:cytochrome c oxidase subunit II [Candidatus Limnocylindrales bacterium]
MHLSVFSPASPEAARLLWLWDACMYVCGFILAVVTLSMLYILVRYRRRGGNDPEPDQTTGNRKLEIAWTAVPLALVGLLFGLSVMTARGVDHPIRRAADIVVNAHQWWWEVRYPGDVVTANEIHIPLQQETLIEIDAADVIHDFWVPQLTRKIDAVPGRKNFVWMRPEQTGVFSGACAEYCGAQHAWMRFRVVVEPAQTYQSWLGTQSAPAAAPAGGDAAAGRKLFGNLTCANCHNIRGINSQRQYAPDLTHVASRQMLAADRLENTPQNLRQWMKEPNVIKPGCYMPNLKLSGNDLTQLTAFLETLR